MIDTPGLPHLGAADVERAAPMAEVVAAVGEALAAAATGGFDQPDRLVLDGGSLLVMAATRHGTRDSAVKTVAVRLGEGRAAAITGTLLWIDGVSGTAAFTADARPITALRTGAVSGVATDLLAPPQAQRMAVLGAGAQAWTQVQAVLAVRRIRELVVWSRTAAHAEAFAGRVGAAHPGLDVRTAPQPDDAVAGAEIVSCATAAREPLFRVESLAPAAHVNAVGSFRPDMAELPTELLLDAGTLAVDDVAGCRAESGEIAAALAAGLDPGRIRPLGELVGRPHPSRPGRTVFKSVGCAVLDWAVGALLARRATTPGGAARAGDD